MVTQRKRALFFFSSLLLLGCQINPKPIEYGSDNCHYCKMTIVDKLHAAQIVNHKGKTYVFDVIECMVQFSNDFDTTSVAMYLCNSYTKPEILIDATKATYLISKKIPSPMGAFLSAFNTESEALRVQKKMEGTIYTWDALIKHLNGKSRSAN